MASGKSNRSIVGQSKGRAIDDYYPTPREATLALLGVETFQGTIWEPACGDGAISKVLEEQGLSVISTDVVDRGYGTAGIDFLLDFSTSSNHVITNPPFIGDVPLDVEKLR